MKHLLLALAALASGLPAVAQTVHPIWEPPLIQGVAAQVEGRVITFEQLRREMAPLVPRLQQEARTKEEFDAKLRELYLDVLQSQIDKVIIVKYFNDKKYQMPQSVIENEFDRILIEDFDNDRSVFLRYVNSQGKNMREFRNDLRERVIVSAMRSFMNKTVSEISPERIEKYYEENRDSFFEEESVKLRLIMLKPIGDESADLMRQQAQKIMGEVAGGMSFEDAARKYSQDSRRSRGGDWGWVEKKDLNKDLAGVAFSLQAGQHSEPVFIGNQVFILYVEDRRPEGVRSLPEVRDQIEDILAGQLSRQVQLEWIEKLRKDAYIRYY